MIPLISIYQQNYGQTYNDNVPVQYRKPKFLAWGTWLFTALQWLHDLLFSGGYSDGSTAPNWVSGSNYAYGAQVIDVDYKVYSCINTAGLTGDTVNPHLDPANWFKVLDSFIGVRERAYYTGQKIMMEYLLNRYFQVGVTTLPFQGASHTGQIYITKNTTNYSQFWLSNNGGQPLTSYLSNTSASQKNFLGNGYSTYQPYNFTVNVPSAIFTAIGNNQPPGVTATQAISAIVSKYCQANLIFNIVTY